MVRPLGSAVADRRRLTWCELPQALMHTCGPAHSTWIARRRRRRGSRLRTARRDGRTVLAGCRATSRARRGFLHVVLLLDARDRVDHDGLSCEWRSQTRVVDAFPFINRPVENPGPEMRLVNPLVDHLWERAERRLPHRRRWHGRCRRRRGSLDAGTRLPQVSGPVARSGSSPDQRSTWWW